MHDAVCEALASFRRILAGFWLSNSFFLTAARRTFGTCPCDMLLSVEGLALSQNAQFAHAGEEGTDGVQTMLRDMPPKPWRVPVHSKSLPVLPFRLASCALSSHEQKTFSVEWGGGRGGAGASFFPSPKVTPRTVRLPVPLRAPDASRVRRRAFWRRRRWPPSAFAGSRRPVPCAPGTIGSGSCPAGA